ncbi:hypothetical protein CANARDRAFT_26660 [[Candida] arabinofermentans NRRL YB-2248]|uniref:RRM domain-containing protein n=1 Tax=[Candida] arabinofermentans NRRL YB-2248 TaxID=983967 RepID=A0A1E4T689_9ASCO|nr:hypothetical protein CANARDRAFT_26660 [[Candida] arabinofermentans NRRL YB-2248]
MSSEQLEVPEKTSQVVEQSEQPQEQQPVFSKVKLSVRNIPQDCTDDTINALIPGLTVTSLKFVSRNPYKKTTPAEGDDVTTPTPAPAPAPTIRKAFITFATEEDAAAALEKISTAKIGENELHASYARKSNSKKSSKKPKASTTSENLEEKSATQKKSRRSQRKKTKVTTEASGLESSPAVSEEGEQLEGSKSDANSKRLASAAARKELKAKKMEAGTPSLNTLFVGGLNKEVTQEELKELFSEYNPTSVKIPRKSLNKAHYLRLKSSNIPIKNLGYAFVKVPDSSVQKAIIEKFNGFEFKGKVLNVTIAIDAEGKAESDSSTSANDAAKQEDAEKEN